MSLSIHSNFTTVSTEKSVDISKSSIVSVFLFGLIILCSVGFLPTSAVHNAAHDTRHTAGFPCH